MTSQPTDGKRALAPRPVIVIAIITGVCLLGDSSLYALLPSRLDALVRTVFEHAKPSTVIVSTPNVEYNVKFENLPAGNLRHRDHRFEWTRSEFETWCKDVAGNHDYSVRFLPVGDVDGDVGAPTQMGVFSR